MPQYASQIRTKTASEVVNVAVDFQPYLDGGEVLTGTPTAVEVTTSALTIASVARNATEVTINNVAVPANCGVLFRVSGGSAGATYEIRVTVTTDATPAQTRICSIRLTVVAD